MNPKKSQPNEEIVVYMSAKRLSQYDIYIPILRHFQGKNFLR